MERLTARDEQGFAHYPYCFEKCNGDAVGIKCQTCDFDDKICNKLAEYEDLEEQGLLLKLPCKKGDTVWDNDYRNTYPYTITGFSFGTGEDYIDEPVSLKEVVYYCSNYGGSITGSFAVSEIGKTVFLTEQEAQAVLEKMKAGGVNG